MGGAVDGLQNSARLDESLTAMSERLNDLYYSARELATDLADRLDAYGFDAGELDQIETRLDTIYRIKQKFGMEVDELLARREAAAAELETFQSSGQKIAELKAQMQTLYAAAKEAAEKLTQSRLKGFAAMNKEMKAALEFLNMPGIRFALKHTRGPLSSHGQDTVEFLISTNPGEEPKPLAKIASGGELSRIMLRSRARWRTATRCRRSSTMRSTPAFPAWPRGASGSCCTRRQGASGALHHPHAAGRCVCGQPAADPEECPQGPHVHRDPHA